MKKDDEELVGNDVLDIGATEVGEDATKYGEFVSSYFAWVSLPEQKKNAKKMQEMTNKDAEKEDKKYR